MSWKWLSSQMRFRKVLSCIVSAAVFAMGLLWTTSAEIPSRAARINALMRTLSERGQFNGSILVAEHGRVIYEHGFGKADIRRNIDFTPSTPVYLASLTKQFTAMAIMMLGERHQLSYRDPLSKYFPEFPSYATSITIRN